MVIECMMLDERDRAQERDPFEALKSECVEGNAMRDVLVFLIPYYTGHGANLDRKKRGFALREERENVGGDHEASSRYQYVGQRGVATTST